MPGGECVHYDLTAAMQEDIRRCVWAVSCCLSSVWAAHAEHNMIMSVHPVHRLNQDPLQHLSSELSDVKKLLHQLLAAQGLSSAAQQHDVAGTQPGEGPCLQAAAEAPSGPKSSVYLDLRHDEQSSTLSQQQQLRTMLGQSLKPSISDAVLLQRAVHATQHVQVSIALVRLLAALVMLPTSCSDPTCPGPSQQLQMSPHVCGKWALNTRRLQPACS